MNETESTAEYCRILEEITAEEYRLNAIDAADEDSLMMGHYETGIPAHLYGADN